MSILVDAALGWVNNFHHPGERGSAPVSVGSAPQLEERRALMVDTGHGIFYYAGVTVTEKTVFQWNPVPSNQLFFIDGGGKLCLFDIAAESVEILAEKVQEFVLSDDGAMAVIAEDRVYLRALPSPTRSGSSRRSGIATTSSA